MCDILLRYSPEGERNRVQRHQEYRQKIIANYQPLCKELYTMNAAYFFVPSFLYAINENKEESFRSVMTEPVSGVFTFEMLQPQFCDLLLSEVENFERWVHQTKFRIMRPNTMNKFGAVLDDFGLEAMLNRLMEDFIRPISKIFFPEVGGATLDSHHGFVVEYGIDRDVELGRVLTFTLFFFLFLSCSINGVNSVKGRAISRPKFAASMQDTSIFSLSLACIFGSLCVSSILWHGNTHGL
ncbi:hypothetical protein SLEP1_g4260 [Rubroshorea leprosula]|nr:hypothetical protein SLEP1_g4260 [Rubroshorea leprosula]